VITLILIPCQYVALEDFKRLIAKLRGKKTTPDAPLQTSSN